MNGKAKVTVNAIPLTGVRMVSLDLKARIAGLHGFTLRVQWNPDRRWRFLFAQPRIRRMHTAYGRRRGRGRW